MKLKKLATVTALAAALVGFGSPAQASTIGGPIGLALVLDESGSISGADWLLQKQGYANVLGSGLVPTDGSLVVGVWKFDDTVEQVFAPTLINDAAAKAALLTAINGMVQGGGLTAIGDGVAAANAGFVAYGLAGLEKAVIDVSTDGQNNWGLNPTIATQNALNAGFAGVNCLGIGGGANCGWNLGGLDFAASDFGDFEDILKVKIATETDQIPEPATLILMSLGLLGLGATRRKA